MNHKTFLQLDCWETARLVWNGSVEARPAAPVQTEAKVDQQPKLSPEQETARQQEAAARQQQEGARRAAASAPRPDPAAEQEAARLQAVAEGRPAPTAVTTTAPTEGQTAQPTAPTEPTAAVPAYTPEQAQHIVDLIQIKTPDEMAAMEAKGDLPPDYDLIAKDYLAKQAGAQEKIPDEVKGKSGLDAFIAAFTSLAEKLSKLIEGLAAKFSKSADKLAANLTKKFEKSPLGGDTKFKFERAYEKGKGVAIKAAPNTELFTIAKGKVTTGTDSVTVELEDGRKLVYTNVVPETGINGKTIGTGSKIGKAGPQGLLVMQYFDNKGAEADPTVALSPFIEGYQAPAAAVAAAPTTAPTAAPTAPRTSADTRVEGVPGTPKYTREQVKQAFDRYKTQVQDLMGMVFKNPSSLSEQKTALLQKINGEDAKIVEWAFTAPVTAVERQQFRAANSTNGVLDVAKVFTQFKGTDKVNPRDLTITMSVITEKDIDAAVAAKIFSAKDGEIGKGLLHAMAGLGMGRQAPAVAAPTTAPTIAPTAATTAPGQAKAPATSPEAQKVALEAECTRRMDASLAQYNGKEVDLSSEGFKFDFAYVEGGKVKTAQCTIGADNKITVKDGPDKTFTYTAELPANAKLKKIKIDGSVKDGTAILTTNASILGFSLTGDKPSKPLKLNELLADLGKLRLGRELELPTDEGKIEFKLA